MKKNTQRLKFSTALFKGGYIHNPLLTQLSGLCPIIMAATNIKNSLYLSAVFALLLILNEMLASAFLKNVSRWVRVCVYLIISSLTLTLVLSKLNPDTVSALGVYLPLLCVNAIIVIRCEKFAIRTGIINSVLDAAATSIGFAAVAVIVGIIRQIISSGNLFGLQTQIKNPGIAMPFAGLLILGFLAAIHKWSIMKFYPNELVDTFSMSDAFEKPVFKDPGLNSKKEREHKKQFKQDRQEFDRIRPRYTIEDVESSLEEKRAEEKSAEKERQDK
ncbi:MAG: Rnf-Nqr domain containing protein [Acutalibacteraceae bacterium]